MTQARFLNHVDQMVKREFSLTVSEIVVNDCGTMCKPYLVERAA